MGPYRETMGPYRDETEGLKKRVECLMGEVEDLMAENSLLQVKLNREYLRLGSRRKVQDWWVEFRGPVLAFGVVLGPFMVLVGLALWGIQRANEAWHESVIACSPYKVSVEVGRPAYRIFGSTEVVCWDDGRRRRIKADRANPATWPSNQERRDEDANTN